MPWHRPHPSPGPLLLGYDPDRDLSKDHLARLVETVVETALEGHRSEGGQGQPRYDPRLLLKVLVYAYATGVRSSRVMERLCQESLPYLYLTRGDCPSYRTLCHARIDYRELIEDVWVSLLASASEAGIHRVGRITVDSTKVRANASMESVVRQDEYAAMLGEIAIILEECAAEDNREETEGLRVATRTGEVVERDRMRDVLRKVRASRRAQKGVPEGATPPEPPARAPLGPRMRRHIEQAQTALVEAQSEGRKHACVTDPDARMMPEGCQRRVRECHGFEVAADNGLIVAGGSTQERTDSARLALIVEAAAQQEPDGILEVVADSGYYSGETVGQLLEAGVDTCIPDTNTACDLRTAKTVGSTRDRTRGNVPLTFHPELDCFHCPEGNTLVRAGHRRHDGQFVTIYRALQDCSRCPQASHCLSQARAHRRTVMVPDRREVLEAARQRFADPDHRTRYHRRAPAVETVFGFLRGVLGYHRWYLRGAHRVASEAALFKTAYQIRKVHTRLVANARDMMGAA